MEHTGIIRRVDDLGRIVLPKEIRRTLRIREGDPLEFIIKDRELTLRKFSSMKPLEEFAQEYLSAICETCETNNYAAYVTDRDVVISAVSAAGNLRPNCLNKAVSPEDERVMAEGKPFTDATRVIVPIVNHGDVVGVIGLAAPTIGPKEVAIAEIAAGFLAKQIKA